jgi:hypothetical protein
MQRSANLNMFKPIHANRFFNNTVFYVFFVVFILIVLAGCSSTLKSNEAAQGIGRQPYEVQQPIPIQTSESDKRPEWTKQSSFEKDGFMHFSGGFLNGSDYALSVRCANAEALKVAIQSISQFVRAEFSEYAQGNNNDPEGTDRYVTDGVATLANNLHIQGVRQKDIFYEEMFLPETNRIAYNVFVILEMSQTNYRKAKMDVLRNFRDKMASTGQIEAKQKAERLLELLKKDVKPGV